MTWTGLRFAAPVLAVAGLAALVRAATVSVSGSPRAMAPAQRADVTRRPRWGDPDSLARVVVARDPFRLDRRPAATPFDPLQAALPGPTFSQPKPSLRLAGLIAGPEPMAVIEGLPGVEGGRIVRRGDVVAGLRVAEVGSNGVRVLGMDTVWMLTLRRR